MLLHHLDPDICSYLSPEVFRGDYIKIAQHALDSARALGISTFALPRDLCGLNPRLKMGFVAQIFNTRLGLDRELEVVAFSQYINMSLASCNRVNHLIPLDVFSDDLFTRSRDGVILLELLNLLDPGTVSYDELQLPATNADSQLGNIRAILRGALRLGCLIQNVNAIDVIHGRFV